MFFVPFVPAPWPQRAEKTFPAPAVGVSSAGLRQTFANYWQWRLADRLSSRRALVNPEQRSMDGLVEGARERRRAARQEFLQQVIYVSPGNLTAAEHLSADLLEYQLRTTLEVEPWVELVERVSQSDGLHNEVFAVIDQMPARSVRDYENIIARLRAVPTYVDQSIELLREQLASGLAQPPIVVDLMIDQVVAQASASPDQSPLLAAFRSFPTDIAYRIRIACATRRAPRTRNSSCPVGGDSNRFSETRTRKGAAGSAGTRVVDHALRRTGVCQPDSQLHHDAHGGERDPSTRLE